MDKYRHHLTVTRELLLQEISYLDDDVFNRISEPNAWSIAQISQHLLKTETLFRKAILHGLKQNNVSQTERKPIEIVSDLSVKYQAPAIAEPDTGPFQVSQIISLLHNARQKFMAVLDQIEDVSKMKALAVSHPRFGDLPLDQWIELLYLHEQRHIEQIKERKARD
ncbi:DinB family protein [Paenibacillus sp. JCM 10914]|uniref:DinB family protein n=1 Tax=Paenibacillus sp. JCM 10914 TaxID=1236974 RepID=UPI0003CC45A3|nr:DinB family protein [Paenibacillus sp. JCM 10914]GAE07489.1 hypothetical protein JCM10914_3720 [Paenibacillus sp. JCM 10914]